MNFARLQSMTRAGPPTDVRVALNDWIPVCSLSWGFFPFSVRDVGQRPAPGLPHPTVLHLQASLGLLMP